MLSPYPLLSLNGSEKCLQLKSAKFVKSVRRSGAAHSMLSEFTVTIPLVFSFTTMPYGFMGTVMGHYPQTFPYGKQSCSHKVRQLSDGKYYCRSFYTHTDIHTVWHLAAISRSSQTVSIPMLSAPSHGHDTILYVYPHLLLKQDIHSSLT